MNQNSLYCFTILRPQRDANSPLQSRRWQLLPIFCAILFMSQPTSAKASRFTAQEFLAWAPQSRAFYIEASIGMASLIAGQTDPAQGQCIDDWYYEDEAAGTASIIDVMRQNPGYHPRGIVLAVLQKQCGQIGQ